VASGWTQINTDDFIKAEGHPAGTPDATSFSSARSENVALPNVMSKNYAVKTLIHHARILAEERKKAEVVANYKSL
jgi:hypothetical protein